MQKKTFFETICHYLLYNHDTFVFLKIFENNFKFSLFDVLNTNFDIKYGKAL